MKIRLKSVQQFNQMLIKKGFTKTDFASEINLSRPVTILLTNGGFSPGAKAAKRITDVLQCEFDDIFTIDDKQLTVSPTNRIQTFQVTG